MIKKQTNTEQLGINRTKAFFSEELGWNFQAQSATNIGVDAVVEIQKNGVSRGQFLALQIESGEENVYKSFSHYTYYLSNVHHDYWLKLKIPMLLVLYIPEQDKLYWQFVTATNFEETATQWSIKIPLKQILISKHKNTIQKFIGNYQNPNYSIIDPKLSLNSENDYGYAPDYFKEANYSLEQVPKLLVKWTKDIQDTQVHDFASNPMEDKAMSILKRLSAIFNIASTRLQNEIFIFSENISAGIFYQQIALNQYSKKELSEEINHTKQIFDEIDKLILIMENFARVFSKMKDHEITNASRNHFVNTIKTLISELEASKEFWQNFQNE